MMAYLFTVYCDSGANIASRYETKVNTEDLGYTDSEWDALNEEKKDEEMKEVAFECLDWGYYKVE